MNYSEIKAEIIGPAVLIMTPFDSDYQLNTDALKKNVRHIVNVAFLEAKASLFARQVLENTIRSRERSISM